MSLKIDFILFVHIIYLQIRLYYIVATIWLDMTSKLKVIFEINTTQGSRIKHISMHPIKNWVGIINENNTFSLWNYEQKILIKSFSCNTLDDNKTVEIKQIVFFDKHTLCSIEESRSMKNNIIFVTNSKLIFYDYITDAIKQTSEKDLDQKNIRRVCVYSQSKICIAMSDGSFKVLDTKQSQNKGSMTIRTIRGYHVKPISWIFAYSQNYNQMPRVITASEQDGLMACWNVEMILKSPSNIEIATPCFKFQSMSKKSKQSISNEQILSLQYDPSSYKIITLNQQYIRFWSSMTGLEIKRIKNVYRFKQVAYFNHFSYSSESFIAHSKGSKILVVKTNQTDMFVSTEIELKNFFSGFYVNNQQQQAQISHIYSVPQHPSHIFLVTSFSMAVMEVDKFYSALFGFHHSFSTKMSTVNSRDLVSRTEGAIIKTLSSQQINGLKFEDDILSNSFFLSVDEETIYFNLIQIQYNAMLHQTRKFKLQSLKQPSPLSSAEGRSTILVNFQGNQIIIFNKSLFYYQIYSAHNQHENHDLLNHNSQIHNRIDFFSKFQLIGSGYARDVVYHQYRRQYAVVAGFDDKDKMIDYKISKDKKVTTKTKQEPSSTTQIAKYAVIVYQKMGKDYKIAEKSNFYQSKIYRIYSFGSFFGYSITKQNQELIQFISSQKGSLREIEGCLDCSEQVYVSYCQSYSILTYDKYFIVLKVQENGSMTYFRTFQYTVLHGFFWEKFFFFLTENALYFMQILNEESIIIKIADNSKFSIIEKIINNIQDDDLEPEYQLLPPGQQQIINIVNMSLVLLNQNGSPTLISLMEFPYILFCLQVAAGVFQNSRILYKNASQNIAIKMKQTMTNYGMIIPDLL